MTTPDPLTRAAAKLRDSVAALPKDLAPNLDEGVDGRWERRGYSKSYVGIPVRDGGDSWLHVASCEEEYDDQGQAIAAHIALTASPDVTTALADLLQAIPPTLDFPATVDPWEIITTVWAMADRLAAAIERQET